MLKKMTKFITVFCLLILVLPFNNTNAQSASDKINVLLLGTDTGYGRTEHGRSDAIMIATFDGETHTITLSTIPRDTLVNIPGYSEDKINHAYAFGGTELSKATIEEWLDFDIDYYVTADMSGYIEIVDAIGGLTVVPPNTFSISGFTFNEGQTMEINGEQALAYARERYTSGGDYARQGRQREMVEEAIGKVIDLGRITQFQEAFETMSQHIETDFTMEEIIQLYNKYKDVDITVEQFQLNGVGQMINGGWYDIADEASIQELREIVQ